ncbi:GDSL esterase/lipase ACHE isoform X2 [Triticum aestivum]|uniref:GDSL esterase/lipase ACHE isoform X2 n=1 Tax=Triticum aestivum TaxID=4565 RepID=UPI001D00AB73|nr:GDSL esterase/lipase ACHE-like isoform X2 [Triticum aestivum]
MVSLKLQKHHASSVLKCGKDKVWIDPNEIWEFEQFTKRSQYMYNRMGGIYHEILPKSEYFSKALYTFHFAQNDLTLGYLINKTTKQIEAYDPNPKERFTVAMQTSRLMVIAHRRPYSRRG